MKYIFITGLLLVAFAIPGVNFYHHWTQPEINSDRVSAVKHWSWRHFSYVKEITIRLETEITALENYRDIERALQEATYGDTITFHLAGYGGSLLTEQSLSSNIQRTRAITIMVVNAPVYSAHAYLAVSGDHIIMAPHSFLMFHAAATGDGNLISQRDCKSEVGMNRGVPNSEHCEADKRAMMRSEQVGLEGLKYLTRAEKDRLYTGNDVYLFPEDIEARKSKMETKS